MLTASRFAAVGKIAARFFLSRRYQRVVAVDIGAHGTCAIMSTGSRYYTLRYLQFSTFANCTCAARMSAIN
jgi:hypothetical protein